jgi:thiol-disulfide isomerase/thioredoxin
MSKRPLWALGAVILTLAGVSIWLDQTFKAAPAPVATNATRATISDAAVMATVFPDLEGRPQPLGQWRGKLLVVNFWATWCAPCREEMPIFDKLQVRYGSKKLQIVGIAADTVPKVKEFQKLTPVRYPLLADSATALEFSKRLGNRLGLLPHTVIFGPDGKQILAKLGPFTEAELAAIIVENLPK